MPGRRMTEWSKALRGRPAAVLLLLALSMAMAGCGGGPTAGSGTTGRLTGKVTVSTPDGPALAASVKVDGTVYQAVGGTYLTNYLAYGTHTITVGAPGYQTQTSGVNLAQAYLRLDFALSQVPDTTAPTLAGTMPEAGTTGVDRNTKIVITFSEPMNQTTVTSALSLSPAVPLLFSWEDDSHLTVTLGRTLAADTVYTVTVGPGARDRAGNALANPGSFSFTTGTAVGGDGRIAFTSDKTHLNKVYLMPDQPLAAATPLLPDQKEDQEPAWSPDGVRLVFTSRRGNPLVTQLFVTRLDTPSPAQVIPGSVYQEAEPKWSPLGGWIAFSSIRNQVEGDWDIFIVPVDERGVATGSPRQVNKDPGGIYGTSWEAAPEWSPDGTVLLFSSDRTGKRLIYGVDVQDQGGKVGETAGLTATCLTPDGEREDEPAWSPVPSPDGTWRVAYVSERGDTPNWDLWLMDVAVSTDAGGHRVVTARGHRQLTNSPANEHKPVWSPDGNYILFVSEDVTGTHLHRIGADGTGEISFTTGFAKEGGPAWSSR
ncbi:MAG: Ig-like domain-containing protein [Chitinophagales bacterium]